MPIVALMDRDEAEWGPSRVDFALMDRRQAQAEKRSRRAKYLNNVPVRERNAKGRFVGRPEERILGDRFTSASGIEAYSTIVTVIGGFTGVKREIVSLPYVSILGPMSRTLRKAR